MFSFFLGLVLASSVLTTPTGVAAEPVLLPETDAPIIDGNVTTLEWTNSARFETTLDNQDASVFVTTNESNIYFAINFTQFQYVELNMTAPVNSTNFNPGLNRTHDFIALQIDRNFDKQDLGSEESPDDVIVINRYENVSKDAFADGNATEVFTLDADNNGTADGSAVVQVVNGTTSDSVSYEFQKNMQSNDSLGADFNLNESRGIQFRFVAWFNQTANASIGAAFKTEWFTLRLNETGSLASVKPITSTPVALDFFGLEEGDKNALTTAMEFSGYNVTDLSNQNISAYGDNIEGTLIFVVGDASVDKEKIQSALDYVKLGGTAIFVLSGISDDATSTSKSIAEGFGLDFDDRMLLTSNQTFEASASDLGNMDYLTGESLATNEAVNTLKGTAYFLNSTGVRENALILSQRYMDYEIISLPSSTYLDSDGDGIIGEDDNMTTTATVAVGFDLLKGGRAVITSLNPLLADDALNQGNIPFFYRTLTWVSKQTQALVGHSSGISATQITQGDKLTVTANVTDLFGNSLKDSVEITALVTRAGSPLLRSDMIEVDGTYNTELTIDLYGWMEVKVSGNASQYGFVEFKVVEFLSERAYQGFNTDKNVFVIALGVGSAIALTLLALKKMKSFAK